MPSVERHPDWVNPDIDLVGVDGNAGAVMGTVARGLRRVGNTPAVVTAYRKDAMSGDYDHLLSVSMVYAGMVDA